MQQSHKLLEHSIQDDLVYIYEASDITVPRLIPNDSYYGFCKDEHHDYQYAIEESEQLLQSTNGSVNDKQIVNPKIMNDLLEEIRPYIYQQPQFSTIDEPCCAKTCFRIVASTDLYHLSTKDNSIECQKSGNHSWNINNNFRNIKSQRKSRLHTQWKLLKQSQIEAIVDNKAVTSKLVIFLGGTNNIFSEQLILDIENTGGKIEVKLKEDTVCQIDVHGVGWAQYPLSLLHCLFIYTSC